MVRAISQI